MTGLHLNAIAFSWLRELSIVAHKLLLLRLTGSGVQGLSSCGVWL